MGDDRSSRRGGQSQYFLPRQVRNYMVGSTYSLAKIWRQHATRLRSLVDPQKYSWYFKVRVASKDGIPDILSNTKLNNRARWCSLLKRSVLQASETRLIMITIISQPSARITPEYIWTVMITLALGTRKTSGPFERCLLTSPGKRYTFPNQGELHASCKE